MRVIIQKRRVVNVEDICAVVDDVDSTFVLVDGTMIRVAERYRKHVKDSVYYWKSLFRQSNELLRSEITSSWTSLKEPNIEFTSDKTDVEAIESIEEDENSETNPLKVDMRTVQIQTHDIQANDSEDTVDDCQSSKEDNEEITEEVSGSDCNPAGAGQTDNDASED